MCRYLIAALAAGFSFLVSACVEDAPRSRSAAFDPSQGPITSGILKPSSLGGGFQQLGPDATGTIRRQGSDRFIDERFLSDGRPGQAAVIDVGSGQVEMNLFNASIEAAAQAVLGETLEKPYVVADGLEGRITLQTTGPVEKKDLLDLFKRALEVNGARIEQKGATLQIVSASGATRRLLSTRASVGDGNAIIVAPLKFAAAGQTSDLLRSIVGSDLGVVADEQRNLLLLTGNRSDLSSAIEALNLFDVNVLKGKSVAIVRLDAAEPEAVSQELETIFDTSAGGQLEGVVEFLPNPRLKSILVISKRSSYISEAESWIRQLDRTAGSARRFAKSYALQNRSAKTLAPILAELLGAQTNTPVAVEGDGEGAAVPKPREGAIQIIADDNRNTIVARAFRKEHEEIARLISELDSSPTQVMLEATIVEVTLTDDLDLGVRWFFESGRFSNAFSDLASGAASAVFPGFSTVFSSGNDRVALSALASITNVKVVSSPTLMVLNNQEAELRIGDQVPIATRNAQSVTDPDAPVVTTIEYRDTGVILGVKPRIGRNGQVVLDINQEVSDVVATTTSGIDSPTIRQRNVQTRVVVGNGQTLALGGIIQERDTKTNTRVPLLGDIPVVGAAFRSTRKDILRTELLILIRPQVIRSAQDARAATDYWRRSLAGPNEILENGLQTAPHRPIDLLR